MHTKINLVKAGTDCPKAKAALIAVHGRGQNGGDMLSLCEKLPLEGFHIIAPESPTRTWYPRNMMAPWEVNKAWFDSTVEVLKTCVSEMEDSGIPSENIYLMGFSQGACLMLDFAAQNARHWGGLIAFTGGLPGEDICTHRYKGNFNGTKIFMGTGANDSHVPLHRAEKSTLVLESMGADVLLKVYEDKPHGIDPDEIRLARDWVFSDVEVLS